MNAAILLALLLARITPSVDLTVNVKGFENNQGKAYVAIYDKASSFPEYGKQYKGKVVDISNQSATVTFKGIPTGSYAVAVYHDANKNGVLDKNLVGYPTEAFGFSNNVRPTISAPSFQSVSLKVESNKTISILVK